MKRNKLNQTGFTIVELMIATMVFSLVMVLCSMAIVHVGRMYYKGIITNRTQDMSRKVLEDVTQAIQFGEASSPKATTPTAQSYGAVQVLARCIGEVRYSYVTGLAMGTAAGQIRHLLWKDGVGITEACTPRDLRAVTPSAGGIELLGEGMRLPLFEIAENATTGNWAINLRVSYGFDPLLFSDSSFGTCLGVNAGGQFCAVSNLDTNVVKRL